MNSSNETIYTISLGVKFPLPILSITKSINVLNNSGAFPYIPLEWLVKHGTSSTGLYLPFQFKMSERSSINFVYKQNLLFQSNNFANIGIGLGIIDGELNFDYSNSSYAINGWANALFEDNKEKAYVDSTSDAINLYIYENSNWQENWEAVVMPTFTENDFTSEFYTITGLTYSGLSSEDILNPSFETFNTIVKEYHLILDSSFAEVREDLIINIVETINLKGLPYPY